MNRDLPVELALPFGIDNQGRIATTTVPREQLRSHVLSIIGTQVGDRVMRPTYGTPVMDMLFEGDDPMTMSVLQTDIQRALETFEPGIIVHSVSAPDDESGGPTSDGVVEIVVTYSAVNSPLEELSIPVNTAALYRGGTIQEERRG